MVVGGGALGHRGFRRRPPRAARSGRRAGPAGPAGAQGRRLGQLPRIVASARKRAAQETAGRSRELHSERLQAAARARLAEAEGAVRDDAEIRVELPGTAVPAALASRLDRVGPDRQAGLTEVDPL
jgi:hypothetical protein